MRSRIRMLKVKVKSLATEAAIIRLEERRSKGVLRNSLCEHRRGIVRHEGRHAQLAYGYLRGRSYEQVEPGCKKPFDVAKVKSMVERFGATWDDSEDHKLYMARKKFEVDQFDNWYPKF